MIWVLALTAGGTAAAGLYLASSRDMLRCVLGLAVLGAAANLVLLATGRLGPSAPAVVAAGETMLVNAANPLPQALVLTAIVIGFALLCFALVLTLCVIQCAGTDDAQSLREAEPVPADPVKPPLPDSRHGPPIAHASGGDRWRQEAGT